MFVDEDYYKKFQLLCCHIIPSFWSWIWWKWLDRVFDRLLWAIIVWKLNSNIIMAGDINQLNVSNLLNQLSFAQLVKVPTRGQSILDVFITNFPQYWKKANVVKSLVRSDHDMVITHARGVIKAYRKESYFRDVRHHNKLKMLRWLIYSWQDGGEILWVLPLFKICFPLIKVRSSTRPTVYVTFSETSKT